MSGGILTWYANIGLLFGVVALLAYSSRSRPSSIFYTAGWLYSSIAVAIVMPVVTLLG